MSATTAAQPTPDSDPTLGEYFSVTGHDDLARRLESFLGTAFASPAFLDREPTSPYVALSMAWPTLPRSATHGLRQVMESALKSEMLLDWDLAARRQFFLLIETAFRGSPSAQVIGSLRDLVARDLHTADALGALVSLDIAMPVETWEKAWLDREDTGLAAAIAARGLLANSVRILANWFEREAGDEDVRIAVYRLFRTAWRISGSWDRVHAAFSDVRSRLPAPLAAELNDAYSVASGERLAEPASAPYLESLSETDWERLDRVIDALDASSEGIALSSAVAIQNESDWLFGVLLEKLAAEGRVGQNLDGRLWFLDEWVKRRPADARVHAGRAKLLASKGNAEKAADAWGEAARKWAERGENRAAATACLEQSLCEHTRRGASDEALNAAKVGASMISGHDWLDYQLRFRVALLLSEQGKLNEAKLELLDLRQQTYAQTPIRRSEVERLLGDVHYSEGDYEDAATAFMKAREIAVGVKALDHRVRAETRLARVNAALGKPEQARRMADRAMRIAQKANDPRGAARAKLLLALFDARNGDVGAARELVAEADEALHGSMWLTDGDRLMRYRAEVARLGDDLALAGDRAREAIDICRRKNRGLRDAQARAVMGAVCLARGEAEFGNAHNYYEDAAKLAADAGATNVHAAADLGRALATALMGRTGESTSHVIDVQNRIRDYPLRPIHFEAITIELAVCLLDRQAPKNAALAHLDKVWASAAHFLPAVPFNELRMVAGLARVHVGDVRRGKELQRQTLEFAADRTYGSVLMRFDKLLGDRRKLG